MEYVMRIIILRITIAINNDISNNADGERGRRKHFLGGQREHSKSILQVNFGENPEKNYKLQKLHISVFWTKLDQTPETNQYLYSKDRT